MLQISYSCTGVGVFWKEISRFTFRQCMHTNVRFFNSESGVATSFTPPCAMGSFADVPQGRTRTQCVFGRSYWRTISASREQVRQRVWICRRAGPVLFGLAATSVNELRYKLDNFRCEIMYIKRSLTTLHIYDILLNDYHNYHDSTKALAVSMQIDQYNI